MKVGFVTGANKGIGFALVERLVKFYGPSGEWDIYLTARDVGRGQKACEELKAKGLEVKFHQLDITNPTSRKTFLDYMCANYPTGINLAVNNAGVYFGFDRTMPRGKKAQITIGTNFTCTIDFTMEFLPLLAPDARIVNVSSMDSIMCLTGLSNELYNKFMGPMDLETLRLLIDQFVEYAQKGVESKYGWYSCPYGVSKAALTKASFILGEMLKSDPRRIVINSCCPGWVPTDLSGHMGSGTPDDGADTPFFLATLPVGVKEPVNEYVTGRKIKKWCR
ncbi:unnamed protein product [Calicophoron daubneyi]|uniref:Carbonyl reductase 1 n=1 Tax=Calicophoron daubneyi TaxID=300641 RepID=A0AAV2TLL4_CALDB